MDKCEAVKVQALTTACAGEWSSMLSILVTIQAFEVKTADKKTLCLSSTSMELTGFPMNATH